MMQIAYHDESLVLFSSDMICDTSSYVLKLNEDFRSPEKAAINKPVKIMISPIGIDDTIINRSVHKKILPIRFNLSIYSRPFLHKN